MLINEVINIGLIYMCSNNFVTDKVFFVSMCMPEIFFGMPVIIATIINRHNSVFEMALPLS